MKHLDQLLILSMMKQIFSLQTISFLDEGTDPYVIDLDIEKNVNGAKLKKCINFSCHLVALSRIIGECFPQNLMLLGETLHY